MNPRSWSKFEKNRGHDSTDMTEMGGSRGAVYHGDRLNLTISHQIWVSADLLWNKEMGVVEIMGQTKKEVSQASPNLR